MRRERAPFLRGSRPTEHFRSVISGWEEDSDQQGDLVYLLALAWELTHHQFYQRMPPERGTLTLALHLLTRLCAGALTSPVTSIMLITVTRIRLWRRHSHTHTHLPYTLEHREDEPSRPQTRFSKGFHRMLCLKHSIYLDAELG